MTYSHPIPAMKNYQAVIKMLTIGNILHIIEMKEHRRINARVLHQHACHVAVAPGVLSFFAHILVFLSSNKSTSIEIGNFPQMNLSEIKLRSDLVGFRASLGTHLPYQQPLRLGQTIWFLYIFQDRLLYPIYTVQSLTKIHLIQNTAASAIFSTFPVCPGSAVLSV